MSLDPELLHLVEARHHDPFKVLGKHINGSECQILVHLPGAAHVTLYPSGKPLQRIVGTDLFSWTGAAESIDTPYQIEWEDSLGNRIRQYDPYCFPPQLTSDDLEPFGRGRHWHAYRFMGAHPMTRNGVEGTRFVVWAPNAERVSVVGPFNHWDGRRHPMSKHGLSGVWELFLPQINPGELYKFEIRNAQSGMIFLKADPYAQQSELRPNTASVIADGSHHSWEDLDWMQSRGQWEHAPMSIYEVHLGSWKRSDGDRFLSYTELADELIPYVQRMGYTHIELLPITEFPFDGSWGYQTTGYFSPTRRFGTPNELRIFIDRCHQAGIGVLLDWVPGHFPRDAHSLAWFDGTALYEYADWRRGEHKEWGTLVFNYARYEIKSFLISSAMYWLGEFHIDGLRVDAVASMLCLDYNRKDGEWLPNQFGGREHIEAIDFIRELNIATHGEYPGTIMIAEESTAWPLVTRPTYVGGLGFTLKWNMGWMHDTLEYMRNDPVLRSYHHDKLTFGLLYIYHENFTLPFSHDEVVHGKGSMIGKMPGDDWQRFANLRLLYTYMWTYPGKKLLFMGCEFGQYREWSEDRSLDWHLLEHAPHQGLQKIVADLNHIYKKEPALHHLEFSADGFEWIDCHDTQQSVISYIRQSKAQHHAEWLVVILNFTPVVRHHYRIGVPLPGCYSEVLNSDASAYGGSGVLNGEIHSEPVPWMGREHSLVLTLPPLGGLILRHHN